MSLLEATFNTLNNIITPELAEDIHTACENESQKMDAKINRLTCLKMLKDLINNPGSLDTEKSELVRKIIEYLRQTIPEQASAVQKEIDAYLAFLTHLEVWKDLINNPDSLSTDEFEQVQTNISEIKKRLPPRLDTEEIEEIQKFLSDIEKQPLPKGRLTYSVTLREIDIKLARNYFSETNKTIMLMKIYYDIESGIESRRCYYVHYNGRYFIVITNGDTITSCVQT